MLVIRLFLRMFWRIRNFSCILGFYLLYVLKKKFFLFWFGAINYNCYKVPCARYVLPHCQVYIVSQNVYRSSLLFNINKKLNNIRIILNSHRSHSNAPLTGMFCFRIFVLAKKNIISRATIINTIALRRVLAIHKSFRKVAGAFRYYDVCATSLLYKLCTSTTLLVLTFDRQWEEIDERAVSE